MSCLFPMKKKTKNIRAGLFVDDISGRSRCYTKFWATNMIIQQAETKFLVPKPTPLPPAKDELMSLILVVLETKSFVRKLVEYILHQYDKARGAEVAEIGPQTIHVFWRKNSPLNSCCSHPCDLLLFLGRLLIGLGPFFKIHLSFLSIKKHTKLWAHLFLSTRIPAESEAAIRDCKKNIVSFDG